MTALSTDARPPADTPEPAASAMEAGLHYVTDSRRGITRRRAGRGFSYFSRSGEAVRDRAELRRIRSLAIPPAWTDVWICPDPNGHIQATGRDEKGRKQYRYHPRWREVRDSSKYGRMLAFGGALPQIRKQVDRDLSRSGLPREKVLATIVRLLETTLIRVGNDEYARANGHYGLTTMLNRHVKITGSKVVFKFRGKGGIKHTIDVRDRRLARVVSRLQELPGQRLFTYQDDNNSVQAVDSSDVNAYLQETTGEEFTAKDFRTWAGTVLACRALYEIGAFETKAEAKKKITNAIRQVAERLGNTPAICRKCYVHPAVIDAYLDGSLVTAMAEAERAHAAIDLQRDESALIALLSRTSPVSGPIQW